MSDSARFAMHRPEFLGALVRGEQRIAAIMKGSDFTVRAGATLIEANTEHDFVYRLLEGWMCRTRLLADGRNQYILIFLPGDLFAVKSMFMSRHPDAISAVSDAVVERVDYRRLHEVYTEDSEVATRCIWQVMEEERRLHSWIVGLGQGSAEERLALLLVDFRNRLILSRSIEEAAEQFDMPLTQSQLADHLGITAVHVNRILKVFREGGIATVRDGQVRITDLEALQRRAAPLLDLHDRARLECAGSVGARASDL